MGITSTVLLPVFNAEEYLEESIESLLGQTYAEFEILAIDDASRDRSPSILADYARKDSRIRILTRPENGGLIDTLNLGLRSCSSQYIFRHDADDRAHPDRLKKCIRYLTENPDTVVLGTWMNRVSSEGKPIGQQLFPETDAEIRWQFLFRNPFAHSTVAFDREKAIAVGSYSTTALHVEDYDLWTRLAEKGRLANLPESLCDYRTHDESISVRHREVMESQSARIGSRWLAHFLGKSPVVTSWEKFRNRESLTPNELHLLVDELLQLSESHPEISGYSVKSAAADIAWQLLSYLKNRPEVGLNPKNFPLFVRLLPALRNWPATRTRWRII